MNGYFHCNKKANVYQIRFKFGLQGYKWLRLVSIKSTDSLSIYAHISKIFREKTYYQWAPLSRFNVFHGLILSKVANIGQYLKRCIGFIFEILDLASIIQSFHVYFRFSMSFVLKQIYFFWQNTNRNQLIINSFISFGLCA